MSHNKDDFKSKVLYVIAGFLLAGACTYGMVEPLYTKATSETREYLDDADRKAGPFDEALQTSLQRMGG